jgi:hypothetical protein
MGSRDWFVRSAQGNCEGDVRITQQRNRSAQGRPRGIFLSAEDAVAMVETTGRRCVKHVQGSETRPSFRLSLCDRCIHNAQRNHSVGVCRI